MWNNFDILIGFDWDDDELDSWLENQTGVEGVRCRSLLVTVPENLMGSNRHRSFYKHYCVFIITDKASLVGEEAKGVGVMKDEELKLEEIEASLTLGG